ncbi:hypothetical protein BGZ73_006114 [Actinomortierella ambigua]|nr:hypothetical protein BGZ73_006114 [Actinomortierella ambigua]
MIHCDGPDEMTMKAIKETIETGALQDFFIHEKQQVSGDENDEETEDEEDDSDFEPNVDLSAAEGYELRSDDGRTSEEDSLVLRSHISCLRPEHHALPPSSPMNDDCADILSGTSRFLATCRRIEALARTVGRDDHAALLRIKDLQRAAKSTLDFFM